MPIVVASPLNPTADLHPRLRTAFSILGYCDSITSGRTRRDGVGRDLIAGELAARNAALELIRHYMNGEVLVDAPPPESPELATIAATVAGAMEIAPGTDQRR